MKSFFDKTMNRSNLEISVEWNCPLTIKSINRMIMVHVQSFLDAYKGITEQQLGLPPQLTKKVWLTKMITDEIEAIKKRNIPYACAFIQDELVGFVTCDCEKPRHDSGTVKQNNQFKNDVFIRLLAIRPSKYLCDHYNSTKTIYNYPEVIQQQLRSGYLPENVRTGLGKFLIECVDKKFPGANAITLDTRFVNVNAREFYEHIGFHFTDSITFGGSDTNYYIGYEKELSRSKSF